MRQLLFELRHEGADRVDYGDVFVPAGVEPSS